MRTPMRNTVRALTLGLMLVTLTGGQTLAAPNPAELGPPRALTPTTLDAGWPRFSPDGARIAFHAQVRGERSAGDIYIVDLASGDLTRLTSDESDDREPAWTHDGQEIVWSSNRDGDYDLYAMKLDGAAPRRITDLKGDEREPAVSPLLYSFLAVVEDGCTASGVSTEKLDSYAKVAFMRRYHGRREVWFAALNGRHQGRLSPKGQSCDAPAWRGDGLALTWRCGRAPGGVIFDGPASWEQDFSAAIESLKLPEDDPGCDEMGLENWRRDDCVSKLPRHYARYEGGSASPKGQPLAAPAYSTNGTLLLANAPDGGLSYRSRADGSEWSTLPVAAPAPREVVWSPDGQRIAFITGEEGAHSVQIADTNFYLQDVRDLQDYPELWGQGASSLLQHNRFVARPGTEREVFVAYEKLNYRRRAPFVTADAALQVFHDEFTRLAKSAEATAADRLLRVSERLASAYAERAAQTKSPADRYLAVLFEVPAVFLRAANTIDISGMDDDGFPLAMMGDDAPKPKSAMVQLIAAIPGELAKVPQTIRPNVERAVHKALAHEGVDEIDVPGMAAPLHVDWSQFKPRGHYASNELCGWFLAVMWYGHLPLPFTAETFALATRVQKLRVGPDHEMTVADELAKIDAFVSAFMGRPVDATLAHVRALAQSDPKLVRRFPKDEIAKRLTTLRGPIPFRGLDGAMSGGGYGIRISLLPRRYGLDVEFFTKLTHPDVPKRALPSALDVLAVLGVEQALAHAEAAEAAADYYDAYREALGKLSEENGRRPEAFWATDLYHGWLALLAALATPPKPSPSLAFTRTKAWADRLLSSALAGYTQLKHQAVLYAFQDYSAECDSPRPVRLLVEQPVLPLPRGFVDPLPDFFAKLGKLADRLYRDMGDGVVPGVRDDWGGLGDAPDARWNAATFARRLETVARKEIAGERIGDDDARWLLKVAPILEAMLLQQPASGNPAITNDEGRTKRGVAIVTDVHTAIDRGVVLEEAIGRLHELYVVVPDEVGARMTEGALLSFYEFTHPMADRLDDDAWNAMLEAGKTPPAPTWTRSFLETQP